MSILRRGVTLLAFCLLTACGPSSPQKTAPTVNETPLTSSPDFPARDSANYEVLVSVAWLKSLLDYDASSISARRPDTYRNQRFVVLEASWAKTEEAKDYLRGHIPRAIHFNTDDLENGFPRWMLLEPEQLQRVFGRLVDGIQKRPQLFRRLGGMEY